MNMHDNILDNLDQYTAKQLVRYIRQGIITLDELCEEGLAVNIRHEIENLLEVNQEDDDWQHACDLNTQAAYQDYLDNYPEGDHRSDARHRIQVIHDTESNKRQVDNDEQEYLKVDKDSIQALENFIQNFPKNKFRFAAKRRINDLKREDGLTGVERIQRTILQSDPYEIPSKIEELVISQKIKEEDVIKVFKNDHNILPADIVKKLDGVIDFHNLSEAEIDEAFIQQLVFTELFITL